MKNIILILILLVISIAGFYLLKDKSDDDILDINEQFNQNEMIEPPQQDFSVDLSEQIGLVFSISEGLVSYSVDKRFFNRPTELVIGKSSNVSGDIVFDPEQQQISALLTINTTDFNSGSGGRDDYVKSQLPENILVSVDKKQINVVDGKYDGNVVAILTIDSVSREVDFSISLDLSENTVVVSGSSEILMSDFGIETPSTLNVYTASDNVKLNFEIKAN